MLSKKLKAAAIISSISSFLLISNAHAALDGPYVGAEVGWGNLHQTSIKGLHVSSSDDTGVAGRGFAGFQFTKNFAFEGGYTKFSNATIKGIDAYIANSTTTINSYSIEALMKGMLPLDWGINIFGKVGAAYINEDFSIQGRATVSQGSYYFRDSNDLHKVFPALGIGISYDINYNIVAELSWMHLQHVGDTDINNVDFVGLGVIYNLG